MAVSANVTSFVSFLTTLVGDKSIDNYWCILVYTVYGGTGVYLELIPLIRTLAQVDDFSENTKVSLSNRDCEAPVPVKILIGMELDVSVDNDTEPSWVKG